MTFQWIDMCLQGGCSYITFQRDEKCNAFNEKMASEVIVAIQQAAAAKNYALILRAHPNSKIWSAGHDLSEIHDIHDVIHDRLFDLFTCILESPVPIISAVNGEVYAGGVIITLLSDMVIATSSTRFFMTANRMGLPLPRYIYQFAIEVLGMHKAKEMFLAAVPLSAYEACNLGLVNRLVENFEGMEESVAALVQSLSQCHLGGMAYSKFVLNESVRRVLWDARSNKESKRRFQQLASDPSVAENVKRLLEQLHHKLPSK